MVEYSSEEEEIPLQKTAIILFVIMYILMIWQAKYRPYIALSTAIIFVVLGILPYRSIIAALNWNVLLMIAGTMVIVHYFIESKMPNRIADLLLMHSKNVMWVTIYMSLFSGVISAFIDNVATVLMVAPVALAVCKKIKISPVSMLICIAVSSNLQGAATLVGDTTSIMLGAYADMDFLEFFWMQGRPGIFFAVELGALLTVPIMMFLFRQDTQKVRAEKITEVSEFFPSFMLVGVVFFLIAASFIPNKPDITNGLICVGLAGMSALIDYGHHRDKQRFLSALRSIDYETLLLLTGLFLVIQGISEVGIIEKVAHYIAWMGGENPFVLYTIIVWISVLFSAFIDNIPYVATMLPVISSVSSLLKIEPYLLYFGLLIGSTLGGNLTPIGASANITAMGMLRKQGYEVSFGDFMKIGVPFALTAVTSGYLFIWLFWH